MERPSGWLTLWCTSSEIKDNFRGRMAWNGEVCRRKLRSSLGTSYWTVMRFSLETIQGMEGFWNVKWIKRSKKIHAQHIRIFCLGTLELFYVFLPSRYIHLEVRNISRKLQMISVHSIQWEKKIQTAKFDLPHVLASICPRCLCVFAGYYTCQAFVVFVWARRVATCH